MPYEAGTDLINHYREYFHTGKSTKKIRLMNDIYGVNSSPSSQKGQIWPPKEYVVRNASGE